MRCLLRCLLLCLSLTCARADEKPTPEVSGEIKIADEIKGSFEAKGLVVAKVTLEVAREIKVLTGITQKLSTPASPAPQRTFDLRQHLFD